MVESKEETGEEISSAEELKATIENILAEGLKQLDIRNDRY